MDLKNLHCFIAVAEQLNFSRAAESLFLSQPSLSIRIKALEDELHTKLFHRTHQQVYLTAEGAALLPEVRDILQRLDALPTYLQKVPAEDKEVPSTLIIGWDPQEDRTDLPVINAAFSKIQDENPHIHIEYVIFQQESFEQSLSDGNIDICLKIMNPADKLPSQFSAMPLMTEPIVLYAEGVDDVPISEIFNARTLLLLDSGDQWNNLCLNWLNTQKISYTSRLVQNTQSLLMNIKSMSGAAFVPKSYAESINKGRGKLYEFPIPNASATLAAVWNKYNIKGAIQLVINELSAAVRKMPT